MWRRVSTGNEDYYEEENASDGWVIWTRTWTCCPLGMRRVVMQCPEVYRPWVTSLMEELPVGDDLSWFCWEAEP